MKWLAQHVADDLQAAGRCVVHGALGNVVFDGVATDSRQAVQGMLFVALHGDRFDAHAFVVEAVQQGARGVMVDQALTQSPQLHDVPIFEVQDTVAALQALAAGSLQRHPVHAIAITGSNGKTTTKDLTAQALMTLGATHATRGNRNNHIGVPLTILERSASERFLVAEMGANDFGEIGLLSRLLRPQLAVITNIGRAHLERFGDEDGVARAKAEIFEGLPPAGVAILNADDRRTPMLRNRLSARRALLFGFAPEADYRITEARDTEDGGQQVRINGQSMQLARAGSGNARNAAAAFAVAGELGAEPHAVAAALERTAYTGQRSVWVRLGDLTVLDDTYNANPDSMGEALAQLESRPQRRVAVLGEMLELGEHVRELHEGVGRRAAAAGVALLLGYGEHMQHAVRVALEAGVPQAQHFDSMSQLLQCLQDTLRPQDAILVKGSRGCRMERVVDALRAEVV
jgi:UDP-N-acetylmuramoyl-tripeptide--D-alanyl-D-alanine ligase